jgi:spermidine synthase
MASANSLTADLKSAPSNEPGVKSPKLPLLLCFLFVMSGSSGLIYEVVWLRMLSRTLGSTVYAASTILAVFMAGLALGSFVFGRFADRVRRPLALYACLEAGIGATAVLSLGLNSWPLPLYRAIYTMAGDSRAALTLGQVVLVMIALLIPTSLMGATLPTLCSYGVRRLGSVGRIVGILYALNTLGAVAGVLAGGFILIGAIGETRTVLVGVAINWLVAVVAMAFLPRGAMDQASRSTPTTAPPLEAAIDRPMSDCVRRTVLVCFGVSGFVSLALEIVWSRMLILFEDTSIYAFSAMLAVMLAGIGLGGWLGARVERWKDPLLALARLELGAALGIALGLAAFRYLGFGYFVPPLIVVGPTAFCLGVAFPVVVQCYTDYARAIGRRVGELYSWNTIGCIFGALAGGFLLIPVFGAGKSGAILGGITAIASVALFAVHPKGFRRAGLADLAGLIVAAVILATNGDPYRDVIFSRYKPGWEIFGHVEEAAATTTSAGIPDIPMQRELLVNGYGMTVLVTGNKLMAHLPIWLSDSPRNALVICVGMGTTFRSATRHSDIDVTAVELVPAVPRFMHFYHADADRVLAQPNAHVVIDDGRNYLLMHQRQFDVITIDPAPPLYGAGTVNLYSKEFFELCARRLRPDGAICLWVPPAPRSDSKMILRTYATVFPFVSVWAGPTFPGFLLIGTLRPVNDIEARVRRGFADPATVADLIEWDKSCDTPQKVLSLWICGRAPLLEFCKDRPIVTDDHPYTEFPFWRREGSDSDYFRTLNATILKQWIYARWNR